MFSFIHECELNQMIYGYGTFFSSIFEPTVVHLGLLLRIKLLMKLLSVALMS